MSLYQNLLKQSNTATTLEMAASDNPGLDEGFTDPTLFCTAFKKNRFYLFSKRQPKDTSSGALFNHEVILFGITLWKVFSRQINMKPICQIDLLQKI